MHQIQKVGKYISGWPIQSNPGYPLEGSCPTHHSFLEKQVELHCIWRYHPRNTMHHSMLFDYRKVFPLLSWAATNSCLWSSWEVLTGNEQITMFNTTHAWIENSARLIHIMQWSKHNRINRVVEITALVCGRVTKPCDMMSNQRNHWWCRRHFTVCLSPL